MQSDPTRCSECGGEMEVGFFADVSDSGTLQQRWARGPVVKRWIGGVKVKESLPVETHRCKNCGLLKSYAK
jgi:hypothetical protein